MELFDTHAHYDDEAFDPDRDELLASLPAKGVTLVVNPAQDMKARRKRSASHSATPRLCRRRLPPARGGQMKDGDLARLRDLAASPKVEAVGKWASIYHYDYSPRDVQQRVLRRSSRLAQELSLPVIFHDREAHADAMTISGSSRSSLA
jgi:TatD DNase family protein